MVPLNNSERRSSFFAFLLFFVLSVGIVVLTAFYGVRVPTKENEEMKKQIESFQKEQVFTQAFAARLAKTKSMLDKINLQGVDPSIDGYISANLDTLRRQIGDDTTAHRKIYIDIVASLSALDQAKKQIRDNSSNSQDKQDLQRQLDAAKTQYSNCETNLSIANMNKK